MTEFPELGGGDPFPFPLPFIIYHFSFPLQLPPGAEPSLSHLSGTSGFSPVEISTGRRASLSTAQPTRAYQAFLLKGEGQGVYAWAATCHEPLTRSGCALPQFQCVLAFPDIVAASMRTASRLLGSVD